MENRGFLALFALILLGLVAMDSVYVVNQTERAVLKRFSKIVEGNIEPGIYGKIPFIDDVIRVDGRSLVYAVPTQAFLTAEKKLLNVDAFVVWRVSNVEKYITSIGGGQTRSQSIQFEALRRLTPLVREALRNEFSARTVYQVVAGTTLSEEELASELAAASAETADADAPQESADASSDDQREALMDNVRDVVNVGTERFGIEVVDIRVKQVDWPDQVRGRVFDRMRAERQRDAEAHRSEGRKAAEEIRANADLQRAEILATAYSNAQTLRGEGDALAAKRYAEAYNKDQEFFRFYRSLQAYRSSFDGPEDVMVLQPDSEFFRYLGASKGAR